MPAHDMPLRFCKHLATMSARRTPSHDTAASYSLKHCHVSAGQEAASADPDAGAVHSPAPVRARRTRKLSDVHEAPDTEAAAAAGEAAQVRKNHLRNLLRKPWLPETLLCSKLGLRDEVPDEEGPSC